MAQRPEKRNFVQARPPAAQPAQNGQLSSLDPELYRRGYERQMAERGRATRAVPLAGGSAPPRRPPVATAQMAGGRPPGQHIVPALAPEHRSAHRPRPICGVSMEQFMQAVEQQRQKLGGMQRLAYALSQRLQRPVDQRTLHRWKLGQHLPPSTRICDVYNVLMSL